VKAGSRAVHAGHPKKARESLSPPIVQTAVYVYDNLEDYDAVARGDSPGHYYARTSNENVAMLAEAVADLEGAEAGVATSSGMAAILVAIGALAPRPCPIVAPLDLYGGTWVLFRQELEPAGYTTRIVDFTDLDAVRGALAGDGSRDGPAGRARASYVSVGGGAGGACRFAGGGVGGCVLSRVVAFDRVYS
jgi:O-acetylhomoserine/O-acetylserine sulfhydrylase-like pyridoxal-dependent enzyme